MVVRVRKITDREETRGLPMSINLVSSFCFSIRSLVISRMSIFGWVVSPCWLEMTVEVLVLFELAVCIISSLSNGRVE